MPGVYVFPGGRLSKADARPSGFEEIFARPPRGLDSRSRCHLAVFARAALRETFEETGLLLGTQAAVPTRTPGHSPGRSSVVWVAFERAGLAPAFGALRLVARAITPVGSPQRFHTRFFLADGGLAAGRLSGDGELEDLRWVPVAEAPALPMAKVTALVLKEALAHLRIGAGSSRTTALFGWVGPDQRPRHRRDPVPRRA